MQIFALKSWAKKTVWHADGIYLSLLVCIVTSLRQNITVVCCAVGFGDNRCLQKIVLGSSGSVSHITNKYLMWVFTGLVVAAADYG
jgi:hypothetical protein